ncbi:MAG TPA: hypothetical protein VGL05_07455 [Kribbella sp.]
MKLSRFPRRDPESVRWDLDVLRRLRLLARLVTLPAPSAPDPVLADDAALDAIARDR